jgi:hypothetical protein
VHASCLWKRKRKGRASDRVMHRAHWHGGMQTCRVAHREGERCSMAVHLRRESSRLRQNGTTGQGARRGRRPTLGISHRSRLTGPNWNEGYLGWV